MALYTLTNNHELLHFWGGKKEKKKKQKETNEPGPPNKKKQTIDDRCDGVQGEPILLFVPAMVLDIQMLLSDKEGARP